jgi:uncharacterized protein YndB with AHSA1/START domain
MAVLLENSDSYSVQQQKRNKVSLIGSASISHYRLRNFPSALRVLGNAMPNTIHLHRVLRAPPERIYRAFLEPEAMVKWLPPHGFTGKVHSIEAKAGGRYQMSFTNFATGKSESFGGKYLELIPHERIRYIDQFGDPKLPGEMNVTVLLKTVSTGTDLRITQEGVPDIIPLEACYLGWQQFSWPRSSNPTSPISHP